MSRRPRPADDLEEEEVVVDYFTAVATSGPRQKRPVVRDDDSYVYYAAPPANRKSSARGGARGKATKATAAPSRPRSRASPPVPPAVQHTPLVYPVHIPSAATTAPPASCADEELDGEEGGAAAPPRDAAAPDDASEQDATFIVGGEEPEDELLPPSSSVASVTTASAAVAAATAMLHASIVVEAPVREAPMPRPAGGAVQGMQQLVPSAGTPAPPPAPASYASSSTAVPAVPVVDRFSPDALAQWLPASLPGCFIAHHSVATDPIACLALRVSLWATRTSAARGAPALSRALIHIARAVYTVMACAAATPGATKASTTALVGLDAAVCAANLACVHVPQRDALPRMLLRHEHARALGEEGSMPVHTLYGVRFVERVLATDDLATSASTLARAREAAIVLMHRRLETGEPAEVTPEHMRVRLCEEEEYVRVAIEMAVAAALAVATDVSNPAPIAPGLSSALEAAARPTGAVRTRAQPLPRVTRRTAVDDPMEVDDAVHPVNLAHGVCLYLPPGVEVDRRGNFTARVGDAALPAVLHTAPDMLPLDVAGLQPLYMPSDGVPIKVGCDGQPPLMYFMRGIPKSGEKRRLSADAVMTLKLWFARNWSSPFPDAPARTRLCLEAGITLNQVADWLRNERTRHHSSGTAAAGADGDERIALRRKGTKRRRNADGTSTEMGGGEEIITATAPRDDDTSRELPLIVAAGLDGALAPRLVLTHEGAPVRVPAGSVISHTPSGLRVLVPANAVPAGLVPLAPRVRLPRVAVDADARAAARTVVMGDMKAVDTATAEKAEERVAPFQETSTWADEDVDGHTPPHNASTTRVCDRWAALVTHMEGVPPLPPGVCPINADGSVPAGAEFVVIPTLSALLVAKVYPSDDDDPTPILVPIGTLRDAVTAHATPFPPTSSTAPPAVAPAPASVSTPAMTHMPMSSPLLAGLTAANALGPSGFTLAEPQPALQPHATTLTSPPSHTDVRAALGAPTTTKRPGPTRAPRATATTAAAAAAADISLDFTHTHVDAPALDLRFMRPHAHSIDYNAHVHVPPAATHSARAPAPSFAGVDFDALLSTDIPATTLLQQQQRRSRSRSRSGSFAAAPHLHMQSGEVPPVDAAASASFSARMNASASKSAAATASTTSTSGTTKRASGAPGFR